MNAYYEIKVWGHNSCCDVIYFLLFMVFSYDDDADADGKANFDDNDTKRKLWSERRYNI